MLWGLYSGTKVWVESSKDVELMSRAMVKLAEHFVVDAGKLFVGLGIRD